MYATIHITGGIRRPLNYHDRKLRSGRGELIAAGNFLERTGDLTIETKGRRFENLMEMNGRAKTKVLLATLGFHPAEKEKLTRDILRDISAEYLERIGLGSQPWLAYCHHDTAHPHLHLIACLIRPDGSRIDTHFIGARRSAGVRRELEEKYGLMRADKKIWMENTEKRTKEKQPSARRMVYGKNPAKPGISRVLDHVLGEYSCTSLSELNAVLREYNVVASRGAVKGRMYAKGGIAYKMLDEKGKPTGIPVFAGSLSAKPTLAKLEKQFLANTQAREHAVRRLQTVIGWTLSKTRTVEELQRSLQKENITLSVASDKEQKISGFIYIDHRAKISVADSILGQNYSPQVILEKMERENEKKAARENEQELNEKRAKEHGHSIER